MKISYDGWQVRIKNPFSRLGHEIYLLRKNVGIIEFLTADGKIITKKEFEDNNDIKPFAYLPDGCLQLLVDEAGGLNIKPRQGFLEGKLEATDKHLEDMRKLVFNK